MLRTLLRRILKRTPAMLPVGTQAPDFDVTDDQGRRVRRADFDGKRFLLWFYPKAATPG